MNDQKGPCPQSRRIYYRRSEGSVMFRHLTAALFAFPMSAEAADLGHFKSHEGREVVTLSGELVPGDADRLTAIIKATNELGREVSGVRLNSPGGSLEEGAKIAAAVRFAKVATVVMNGTTCASACFVAFAAGAEKYASYSARVGVHGASNENGSEAPGGTVAMAKIVKDLGVPPAIIGEMVVTPPEQMVWLSPADLQSMGVKMTGKPMQTEAPPLVAQVAPRTPALPLQSAPALNASLPMSSDEKWRAMINEATAKSSAQNGGKANFNRACQPELKLCTFAITFKGADGTDMMVRVTTDADGRNISRDLCMFNAFGDIRQCLDWDKGTTSKDMKNAAGQWVGIGD